MVKTVVHQCKGNLVLQISSVGSLCVFVRVFMHARMQYVPPCVWCKKTDIKYLGGLHSSSACVNTCVSTGLDLTRLLVSGNLISNK